MRKKAKSSRGRWVTRRQRHGIRSFQTNKSFFLRLCEVFKSKSGSFILTRAWKGPCKSKSLDITISVPGMRNYFDSHVQNKLE